MKTCSGMIHSVHEAIYVLQVFLTKLKFILLAQHGTRYWYWRSASCADESWISTCHRVKKLTIFHNHNLILNSFWLKPERKSRWRTGTEERLGTWLDYKVIHWASKQMLWSKHICIIWNDDIKNSEHMW